MISQSENKLHQQEANQTPTFSLSDLLKMVLANWYWFVLSVVLCTGVAYLYIASTEKVYTRSATILVKDSRKGGDASIQAFSELAGFSTRRNVDNEIYILQSRRLMEQVVKRLDLTKNYSVQRGLRSVTLYNRTPINVEYINSNDHDGVSMEITLGADSTLTLHSFNRFEISKHEQKQQIRCRLNDTVNTPIGSVVVTPTLYYNEEYIDTDIVASRMPLHKVTNRYRTAVKSNVANKMSSIINLTMRDVVPQRAEDVLNTLIAVYNLDAVEDKRAVARETATFIDNRLAVISEELGKVDSSIQEFKRTNNIYDLETEAERLISESSKYKIEGLSIDNQIAMSKYIHDFLVNESQNSTLIPAGAATIAPSIAQQINDYNIMVLSRNKLAGEGNTNNPMFQNLNNMVESNRKAIISSLAAHIKTLEIQSDAIRKEERATNYRIRNASAQEKDVLSSVRQQKVKEELYLYLLQKREENELALEVVEPNSRIVDHAFGPSRPDYPNTIIIMAIALIIGLGIPFLVIYLLEVLDTTIRGRKDIEDHTSIPFLGEIPQFNGTAPHGIVVHENGRDSVSEAFRILRTNMNFMNIHKDRELKVIMITSSNPHAGKTFVSTNLAMTMAMAGKRVLLVDFDLRRRSLSKVMGHGKDSRGLTSYLSGTVKSYDDLILESEIHHNLDMMYAGVQPPNPAEMLLSERLDTMMTELRKQYDYIIMDSVPALIVADAMILDRLCDLTIYVVREGLLDRRQLPDIERFYREKRFSNLSIILNGSTIKRSGYGYGYGYGYSYGYGEEESSQKRGVISKIKGWFN